MANSKNQSKELPKVILASTSKYRIQQLKDFGLPFLSVAPRCDEEEFKSKKLPATRLCQLLAFEKAKSVLSDFPNQIVIGADQLVAFQGHIMGKPGSAKNAEQMLKRMQGRSHLLITSICILYKRKKYSKTVTTKIQLRKLSPAEIRNYLQIDQPLDCAGSYKLEKAGLRLVKKIATSDPSSLTGLPLLAMTQLLLKIDENFLLRNIKYHEAKT